MPRFLDMLRAKNIFGGGPRSNRSPLGMPDIDDSSISSMFGQAMSRANSMKNDDMRRQQQMMEFEASLARRNQPQATPMAPPKKNVVYGGIHPPTTLQKQFREDDVDRTDQKNRMATLGATQTGALNNALITGKQRDDADMARTTAEINGRSSVAQMNKEMAAKAADDARTDKERTDAKARLEKNLPVIMDDPDNPGQKGSFQWNPALNRYDRTKVEGRPADSASRMGIDKPGTNQGVDPKILAGIRTHTQSTLDELDQLLDPKTDKLTSHTEAAVGPSRILGNVSNYWGAGSLTPETTKGRTGIDTLKGKLVLDLIGQLKAQSRTGATGFGAMNLKELGLLEASASKLNPDMSEKDFTDELKRIRERLRMIMKDPDGPGPLTADSPKSSGSSDADKRADEIIKAARGGR